PRRAARPLVVPVAKPSAGHAPEVPVQFSATSHPPAEARQTVLADTNWQVAEQQKPACPLFAPRSHCSLPPAVPSPHVVTSKTVRVTKCLSSLCSLSCQVPGLPLENAGQGPPPS